MKRPFVLSVILLTVLVGPSPARSESACSGVNRALSKELATRYGQAAARQLGLKQAQVLDSFQFRGWSILYVAPIKPEMENVYLFYSADPIRHHYVTEWSGAAAAYEKEAIRSQTLKDAPGIPRRLAACFAWYVTNGS